MQDLPEVTIAQLLDAGVHFGHKATRWNPKMAPYIYGVKDNIHIIDLQQTAYLLKVALKAMYDTTKKGGKILFVSTKVQASDIIAEYAQKCNQFYVNHRWLGGLLTNWETVSKSIKTLTKLEESLLDEELVSTYTKKEILDITRRKDKLLRSLGGIRTLKTKPDLIVIIDTNKEHLAIDEALALDIPILAVLDTNSNPDNIQYPVPGNDDAIRSIRLYCHLFASASLAGSQEALIKSGVDVGAIESSANSSDAGKVVGGIKKLKQSNKLSKSNIDPSSAQSTLSDLTHGESAVTQDSTEFETKVIENLSANDL